MNAFLIVLLVTALLEQVPAADAGPDAGNAVEVDAGSAPDAAVPPAEDPADDEDDDAESDDDDLPDAPDGEEEQAAAAVPAPGAPALKFTGDLDDPALLQRWKEDPASLGSISVGFADAGRIINGVQFPPGPYWSVVAPEVAWGVQESIDSVMTAITQVNRQYPGSPLLRVNHISRRDGGYLRPHQSHQAGRDVDLAFYYLREVPPGYRGRREQLIDPARNWALIKAFATMTDVQVILVDRRIQKVLYDHALASGEDKAYLDDIFKSGSRALVKHARRHRDHFHVRLNAPRSQELGRRVQPLLAQRPDQNMIIVRVRSGHTLGHIAAKYDTSVRAIMRANHMKRTFLRVGQTLVVPLRGPCTQCPMPPEPVVPPRRIPPGWVDPTAQAAAAVDAGVRQPPPATEAALGVDAGIATTSEM
ncbi:MAG: penicillin-insensitive murein endopeptidase [Deltaproteobacteria bacterium]|nr:penicillin-insensitive murein endopeptidase [Deltaproteobacteria bacterium]